MIWIKRMLLGGFIVNLIYISIMFLHPGLSVWLNTMISGSLTGGLFLFLIRMCHI